MEQEVGQGDTEVTGELTTVTSSNNTNPFFEEVGKNPFLEDDKNPFHNNNDDDDDDDDDDKNPFKESKSTNPFDEDEGKSGPKQKLCHCMLSNYFIYGVFNCLISEPLASSSPGSSSSRLVKVSVYSPSLYD